MKVTYDLETDTLTVVFRAGPAKASEEGRDGIIFDYDADERLVAVEILDASTRVDDVHTVQLQVVPKPRERAPAAAE
jgi:uncharacterized protein YuzE